MKELIDLDVWNDEIKESIIANKGSVQHIEGLSDHIKEKYKIVWEMSMKELIDMARDRGVRQKSKFKFVDGTPNL